jgi:hypothetical protein
VIEIGPLLRLADSSHQFNASKYVLAERLVAVNRSWARPGGPCLAGKIVEYRGKSGVAVVEGCSVVRTSAYAPTPLALGPWPSQLGHVFSLIDKSRGDGHRQGKLPGPSDSTNCKCFQS